MKTNISSLSIPGFLIIIFYLTHVQSIAQEAVPLHSGVYDQWKTLNEMSVSTTGKIIHYTLSPQLGDGALVVYHTKTSQNDTFARGASATLSPDESFIAYRIKPTLKSMRKAKMDGKKKDELPQDSLGITVFGGNTFFFPDLKTYTVPSKSGNFVLALIKQQEIKPDSTTSDSIVVKNEAGSKEKSSGKKKDKTKTFILKVIEPGDSVFTSRENITEAIASDFNSRILYSTFTFDSLAFSEVRLLDVVGKNDRMIFSGQGYINSLILNEDGNQGAFLFSSDTSETRRYQLFYFDKNKVSQVADTASVAFPSGYCASENGKIYFSEDGSKLYFGVAPTPRPEPKDTLPDDEIAHVDVWHWKDPLLMPQQLKQLDKEKKRTLLTVFHPMQKKLVVLATDTIQDIKTSYKGNGRYALGFSDEAYQLETSWRGERYRDIYLIDNVTGKKELLLKRQNGPVSLSTTEKYISWYSQTDSLWFTMNLKDRKPIKHSAGNETVFYDEEHDVPGLPGAEGSAGWSKNDEYFVVYDKFDLWGLKPGNSEPPLSLTSGLGRKNQLVFRNVRLNNEVPHIGDEEGTLLLSAFDEKTKSAGYYKLQKGSRPQQLIFGPYKYSSPKKARLSDTLIYTRGSFTEFPDIWFSDGNFKSSLKISTANPQQSNYLWGSVELVDWTSTDGQKHEGLLYKPANFDAGIKYPMLVYFYEKYSNQLHQHYFPKPSRSIISPTYCSSNGYVVFIPDITYSEGYPGQSAYNAVLSGTLAMLAKGFIDPERMGIQGQSWGGYQVAWLVTRTNLFKAAMAGAPVSNMTSAYGGIRWESGMVRQFQYEEGQSRIGANLWQRPDLYIENSPIFRADKIETPLLIMSNDGDGAVPWYQGIELFTAMRRLSKPAWLLNYNNDEHNLARRANMLDLDRRMMQFFDHYLKGGQMPEWMEKGVPAVDKK